MYVARSCSAIVQPNHFLIYGIKILDFFPINDRGGLHYLFFLAFTADFFLGVDFFGETFLVALFFTAFFGFASVFLVATFFLEVAFLATGGLLAAFFLEAAFFALAVTADLVVVAGFGEVAGLVVAVFATGATAFGFFKVGVFSDLDSALATSSACSSQKKFPDLNRTDLIRSAQFPEEIDSFDCSLSIS